MAALQKNEERTQTIGFVGLGNMGGPMAINLVKKGHKLKVFDLEHTLVKKVTDAGAEGAKSLAECVTDVDIVITMLPGDAAVRAVYEASDGILAAVTRKAILIDSSTVNAATSKDIAMQAQRNGLKMLDAPVSGGTAGATAGTLTFIVGGEPETLDKVRPLLEAMGKTIFHAGGHGAGQMAKICNNMLLGVMMVATSEALNLGMEYGLKPKTLSDIMVKSSGRNWVLELYNPIPGIMENVPASREYQGGFGCELMAKDLALAQEAALAHKTLTPMGSLARQLYQLHVQAGNGKLDFSHIVQMFKKQ